MYSCTACAFADEWRIFATIITAPPTATARMCILTAHGSSANSSSTAHGVEPLPGPDVIGEQAFCDPSFQTVPSSLPAASARCANGALRYAHDLREQTHSSHERPTSSRRAPVRLLRPCYYAECLLVTQS